MIGRLLQFLLLIFFIRIVWQHVVRWLGGQAPKSVEDRTSRNQPIYRGQMVRDPVCGVYIPQEGSVEVRQDHKVFHFCSEACRESFRKAGAPAK